MLNLRGASASELLRKVLSALVEDGGTWDVNAPRGMPIREFRYAWLRLDDVSRCAAWLPGRKLNYPFMAAEFVWIFCGRDDLEMIGHYNKEIAKFSDDGKHFFGAYGPRWRGQIPAIVENLRRDHDSRQAVVSIWRPESLRANGEKMGDHIPSKDVPCTLTMQYMLRNEKLEAAVVMRSSDAWLGLPYDIFNFAMLQRAVAAELAKEPGPLTLFIGSSHLYERNLEAARSVVSAELEYHNKYGTHPACLVQVPAPPGIDEYPIKGAEAAIRGGFMCADVPDASRDPCWNSIVSILAYRNHRTTSLLAPPWDLVAGDYVS